MKQIIRKENKILSKIIFIDAGHGGTDKGAVSGKFIESELNLKAALAARDYLKGYDCEVIMSRTADTATKITDMAAKAKIIGAAASVSIHHNAGGGDGGEAYYWYTDMKAKQLAQELCNRFLEIGQNLRGVKPSSEAFYNFGMCRINAKNGIPAVLGEFAFLDNAGDSRIIDTDAELKTEGEAYGKALVSFLKLAKKPEAANSPIAGEKITLKNAALYSSATEKEESGRVTGTYWLYDGLTVNSRCRITNKAENAGKRPVDKYVTGWIALG